MRRFNLPVAVPLSVGLAATAGASMATVDDVGRSPGVRDGTPVDVAAVDPDDVALDLDSGTTFWAG